MVAAASKPHLRAVPANEKPKPRTARKRKLGVSAAASRGTKLDLLVAMRDRVAKAVEDPSTPARDLAALTRRLLEISKDIDVLNAAAKEAASDGDAEDEPLDPSAL